MKWAGRRQSGNVSDRRGMRAGGAVGGVGIIVALLYAFISGDYSGVVNSIGGGGQPSTVQTTEVSERQKEFVSVVLADTEDVWNELFRGMGREYPEPQLVLFTDRVQSACGTANSAVGPFYCPGDKQVYIDLGFFEQLSQELGARGDFAQAYVIAHEVGHHVQNVLGLMGGGRSNQESVATELQADCLAGVWAKMTDKQKQVLESGDLEEALGAAAAVGDDKLQQRAQGYVVPDAFTHGSAQQRAEAFSKGFSRGAVDSCVGGMSSVTGR